MNLCVEALKQRKTKNKNDKNRAYARFFLLYKKSTKQFGSLASRREHNTFRATRRKVFMRTRDGGKMASVNKVHFFYLTFAENRNKMNKEKE